MRQVMVAVVAQGVGRLVCLVLQHITQALNLGEDVLLRAVLELRRRLAV
jgi:hypothetical protein